MYRYFYVRSSIAFPAAPARQWVVPRDPRHCPADIEKIAEAYCMDTLDQPARVAFEDHYLTCAQCAAIVADMEEYICAMKKVLRRLRPEGRGKPVAHAGA